MSLPENVDVVGVGFGPSNLSLAIALEEHPVNGSGEPIAARFFERLPAFSWHRHMLLPSATMQVAFLKDLATFRNPVSRFSFVSYLHATNRLVQFVNNKSFFPTRQEFHKYLEWAESSVSDQVSYGTEVTAMRLRSPDRIELVSRSATGGVQAVTASNVVISTGLVPRMPAGIERDDRVWHSSEFLDQYARQDPSELKTVAVVGAGQSAAEITRFLYDSLPHAQVYAILPSYGYSVADDTPFANQVFDPAAVDEYYFGTDQTRDAFWRYHSNTNYSVVDDEVIRELYRRTYHEDVLNVRRLHFVNLTKVEEIKRTGNETRASLKSLLSGAIDLDVDAIVFATGYHSMEPARVLGELDQHCLRDEAGRYRVERDYRLVTTPELSCGIYLQGGTEHTHGLTSSLLSNIAIRSGEIAESIVNSRAGVRAVAY
ncbi:MAG: SidA/IucD/PvdA family monooxygenase [Jatrophihabitantaceae bacterium]